MEITKIILYLSLLVTFSCVKNNKMLFYIQEEGIIKEIDSKEVVLIEKNIYKFNSNIYIGSCYSTKIIDKGGGIKTICTGTFLHYMPNINLDSYQELIEDKVYKDKNNVYIISKEKSCHLCLKVLEMNSPIILGDNYIGDDKSVYCIGTGEKMNISSIKKARIFKTKKGMNFLIFKKDLYYNDEKISIENWKEVFSQQEIDSINDIISN